MLRAAHIIVSVGWLGLVVAMLVLGLSAAGTSDPTFAGAGYTLMAQIGGKVIAAFAVATLLTGAALSLATPWGLIRHRWIVAKLVITIAVIVTAIGMTNGWVEQAAATVTTNTGAGAVAAWLVVAGSGAHLLLLALAAVISVEKPWGPTRRGRRLAARP